MSLPYYTKGDNTPLLLKATVDGLNPWNLTSATLETTFKKWDGGELVIADADHTITTAASGEYQVDWTSAQTVLLMAENATVFKTKITQSGVITTIWYDKILDIRESKAGKQL